MWAMLAKSLIRSHLERKQIEGAFWVIKQPSMILMDIAGVHDGRLTTIADALERVFQSYTVALQIRRDHSGFARFHSGFAIALWQSLSQMQNIDKVSHWLTISTLRILNNRLE